MKKKIFVLFTLFLPQSFLFSNPIDNTAIANFSELIFNFDNSWIMEIGFPFGDSNRIDSIIFCVSDKKAKLNYSYTDNNEKVALITSNDLTVPLSINLEGDKITIYTYSRHWFDSTRKFIRGDSLLFGNYPGATVGQPSSGYSIYRVSWSYSYNTITVDCLNKHPTLGAENDTVGLSATLRGYIYDADGKLVTKLKKGGLGDISYFVLETPLAIDSNGVYITKIFPTLCSPTRLMVRFVEFYGAKDFVEIEPFELKDILPGTVTVQDIHLKDNRYVSSVGTEISIRNDELILINYSNPFNLSTKFFLKVPARMRGKAGRIDIFNMIGQRIINMPINDGMTVSWDSKNDGGTTMPSGIYYYTLNIDNNVIKTGSIVLIK
jgi:hypothetical protein